MNYDAIYNPDSASRRIEMETAYRKMYDSNTGVQILAQRLITFVFRRSSATTLEELAYENGERNFVIAELEHMGIMNEKNMISIAEFMLNLPSTGEQMIKEK